jgi:dUTP pyrophosphatase
MADRPKGKASVRVKPFKEVLAEKIEQIEASFAVPFGREDVQEPFVTKVVADEPDFIPQYETDGSACCDLRANVPLNGKNERKLAIPPGAVLVIDCGFSMQLPPGYEAQVRARSGLATKGLTMANGIGTIDEDYRDRMKVIAANIGRQIIVIEHKSRIAQMALKAVERFHFQSVEALDPVTGKKVRTGGLGSTGVE